MNAKEYVIDAANTDVKSISGNIDKMTIKSRTDNQESHSGGFSVSSTGQVGVNYAYNESQKIGQAASLHVADSIDPSKLKIGDLYLEGAKFLSDKTADLSQVANKIHTKDIQEFDKAQSVGVSFNVNDFKSDNGPNKNENNNENNSENSGDIFSNNTVSNDENKSNSNILSDQLDIHQIHFVKVDYSGKDNEAVQKNVIRGETGTLLSDADKSNSSIVTTNTSGKEVTKDENFDYRIQMPVKFIDQERETVKLPESVLQMNKLSGLVYSDENAETLRENNVDLLVNPYIDEANSAKTSVYIDIENKNIVISVKGTDSQKALLDDWDILQNEVPRSYTPEFKQYVADVINKYGDEYNISFTGHSRGAYVAALLSSDFKKPAIIFDSPHLMKTGDYSNVLSIKSTTNLINGGVAGNAGETTVQLQATQAEQAIRLGLETIQTLIPSGTWSVVYGAGKNVFDLWNSHANDNFPDKMTNRLNKNTN